MKFRKGETIVCVNNSAVISGSSVYLTLGGYYVANGNGNDYLRVVNDNGSIVLYSSDRFMCLSQYRNIVINSVLDI